MRNRLARTSVAQHLDGVTVSRGDCVSPLHAVTITPGGTGFRGSVALKRIYAPFTRAIETLGTRGLQILSVIGYWSSNSVLFLFMNSTSAGLARLQAQRDRAHMAPPFLGMQIL